MKFMVLIYNDTALMDAMPKSEFDAMDGPFAETKEVLGVEVRRIRDIGAVRERVANSTST